MKQMPDTRARTYYKLLLKWIDNMYKNKHMHEYFIRYSINSYAVYGVGELGGLFLSEMYTCDLKPEFIIERSSLGLDDYKVPIISVEELHYMKNVECIVITAPLRFNELQLNLLEHGFKGKIVSLDDIIFDR